MNKSLFEFVTSKSIKTGNLEEFKATGNDKEASYKYGHIVTMMLTNDYLILISSLISAINNFKASKREIRFCHILSALSINGLCLNTGLYICKNEIYFKPHKGYRECLLTRDKTIETLTLLGFNTEEMKHIFQNVKYFNIEDYRKYLKNVTKAITERQRKDSEFWSSIKIEPSYYIYNEHIFHTSYADKMKEYAIEHTKNATPSEQIVIKLLNANEIKYEFQKTCNVCGRNYIMDFFLTEQKICLEIDGGYHYTQEQLLKDRQRDNDMARCGILVIRLTNEEVNKWYSTNPPYDLLKVIRQ